MSLSDDESYLADIPDYINDWHDGKHYLVPVSVIHPSILRTIQQVKRDALEAAAELCDKSEDECTADPCYHEYDAEEIRALMPKDKDAN